MASQKSALLMFVGIATIGFIIGMGYLIYGAIAYREPNLIGIVIGIGSLMIFPPIGLLIDIRRERRGPSTAGTVQGAPAVMRYESGKPNYCPLCHANLGANPPRICPECGYRISE